MTSTSEYVKQWRLSTKIKMIESMGGKCQCCGYNRSTAALELHHIDPSQKDFAFGRITANPAAWYKIAAELLKCILVCANCHREIHNDNRQLPETFVKFDESLITSSVPVAHCKVCGKSTFIKNKTCSTRCAQTLQHSIEWDKIDLSFELQTSTVYEIATKLGISAASVIKRCVKVGLDYQAINAARKSTKLSQPKLSMRKAIRPDKETLQAMIWAKPLKEIAKEFNISDTAIQKWIRSYKLEKPGKGYWQKLKFNKL